MKYDSWHKETVSKFATFLSTKMGEFYGEIKQSRSELEKQSTVMGSTSDAVSFITYVQILKKNISKWEQNVTQYKEGQRILEVQRFQFPQKWLYVENIEGEWGSFNEIIKRKDSAIQTQVDMLRAKIIAEDKAVETRTSDFLNNWMQSKPTDGHLRPEEALNRLQVFETRFMKLKEERDSLAKAKEALELHELSADANEDRVGVVLEELEDLKGVWSELAKIWCQIDEVFLLLIL